MFFVLATTLYAMFQQVALQWSWFGSNPNNLLFVFGAIIFVFAIWISITALSVLTKDKGLPPQKEENIMMDKIKQIIACYEEVLSMPHRQEVARELRDE